MARAVNRLKSPRPIGTIAPPIGPVGPISPQPPVGPIKPPVPDELGNIYGPGFESMTALDKYLADPAQRLSTRTNAEGITTSFENYNALQRAELIEKFRSTQETAKTNERTIQNMERQNKTAEDRLKLDQQKQVLDQQKEALDRQTTSLLEQGKYDEAFAVRQNSFSIDRAKRQIELREQNMNFMQALISNPLLLPALQGMGGMGQVMGRLGGMPAMQGPGRQRSMLGEALPFHPGAVGGADMGMSQWGMMSPQQQAFMYQNAGLPMPTRWEEGQMYGGEGWGGGGGMDPSLTTDLMSRSYGFAALDRAAGSRPSGKLVSTRR